MITREAKSAWVTGKVTGPDREKLERIAAERFDGNVSQALRFVIRAADPSADPSPAREMRSAPGGAVV